MNLPQTLRAPGLSATLPASGLSLARCHVGRFRHRSSFGSRFALAPVGWSLLHFCRTRQISRNFPHFTARGKNVRVSHLPR